MKRKMPVLRHGKTGDDTLKLSDDM